jgi:ABC-type branched-subunit amino acid transport system ATPase component
VTRLQLHLAQDAVGDTVRLELGAGEAAVLPGTGDEVDRIAGRVRARPGDEVVVDGRRLTSRSPAARVRAGLVVVDAPALAPAVSVADHLAAVTSRRRAHELLEATPRLAGRSDDPAGVLSGGERRLLGWVRAVLLEPVVVVLDRAATGLDTSAVRWADAQVARWRDGGVCVLVRVGRVEEAAWGPATSTERPPGA